MSYNRYKPIDPPKAQDAGPRDGPGAQPEEQQFKKENEIILIEELQMAFDLVQF